MRRFLTPLSGLLVLMIGLSGCIKMDMDMKIKSGDKIDGVVVLAFKTELMEMMGQKKADMVKSIKADWKDLPKGAKAEIYDKDGFIGQKIVLKDMPAAEFGKATNAAGSTSPTGGGDDMKLVKEGNTWKFTGKMDMKGDSSVSGDSSGGPDMSALMKGMQVKIKLTFPGKIIKHDKDAKVSGNSVTWNPKAGQVVNMLVIANQS